MKFNKLRDVFEVSNSYKSVGIWSLFSVIVVSGMAITLLLDRGLYINLAKEGANTELLTAVFYFVAGIFFFIRGYKEHKSGNSLMSIAFLVLFGLFFIFIAGEEESWGQWLVGYEPPQTISDINYQGETNIHNFAFFKKYDAIFNQHRILNLFVLVVGIIIPLFYRYCYGIRKWINKMFFPVCPFSCSPMFVLAMAYEKTSMMIFPHWANVEIREFLFSIGFLLCSIAVLTRKNVLENSRP